jgi:hypothetical protein
VTTIPQWHSSVIHLGVLLTLPPTTEEKPSPLFHDKSMETGVYFAVDGIVCQLTMMGGMFTVVFIFVPLFVYVNAFSSTPTSSIGFDCPSI